MSRNPIVGTWRLLSLEKRTADGQTTYPLGKDATGYLAYGDDGHMSVQIMAANRAPFAVGDIRGGTAAEKNDAADTYVGYCGTYTVLPERVIHDIRVSFFPNWVGVDQERFFALDGDRLKIQTGPYLVGGIMQTSDLVWQRV
jgi:hypothetical protein